MIPQATETHYRQQRRIAATSVAQVRALWRRMGNDLDASWFPIQAAAVASLTMGQVHAAADAAAYMPAVLRQTGQADLALAEVAPAAFGGVAADGRRLESLMYSGVTATKSAIGRGYGLQPALLVGGAVLDRLVFSEITRAGSSGAQVAMTARPNVTGYTRMVSAGACANCVILAGKWFRWNQGFERHPRCNCRHIPAAEALDGDFTTDPYAHFNSLSREAQDKLLGEIGAQTVRDGGDIYRVVNIKNRGLGVSRQAVRYGTPMKLTPEQIYARMLPREETLRLLRSEGYITGTQVAGGNIVGRYREAYQAPISRPIVAGSKRDRVLTARETGVRDPLDRATMTAAERRLYDANYRLEYAKKYGYLPRSIGMNSADLYSGLVGAKATAEVIARLEATLQRQLATVRRSAPNYRQMKILTESLGLTADAFTSSVIFDAIEKKVGLDAIQKASTIKVAAPVTAAGGGGAKKPPTNKAPAASASSPRKPDIEAMFHIMYGDNKGGGHLHGMNIPGKTEFPRAWTRNTILAATLAVQSGGRRTSLGDSVFKFEGMYRGVMVRVVIADGRVQSAYPLRGNGVEQNIGKVREKRPLQSRDRTRYNELYEGS